MFRRLFKSGFLFVLTYGILLATSAKANNLQVGFAQLPITPSIIDERYSPIDPRRYLDRHKWQRRFRSGLIAGFQKGRAAQGIKDDLMAIAVVIDDGDKRIAIVAMDTSG